MLPLLRSAAQVNCKPRGCAFLGPLAVQLVFNCEGGVHDACQGKLSAMGLPPCQEKSALLSCGASGKVD